MKSFRYTITDKIGIHARPAGLLVKEAQKYKSKITVSVGDRSVSATGLMGIMSLGVRGGQTVEILADGEDEEAALEGMKRFFEQNL